MSPNNSSENRDASLGDHLFAFIQKLLPQHALSGLMHKITRIPHPGFKNAFIGFFMKRFKIDLGEAQIQDPKAFSCFNQFFTRALKADARPICETSGSIACPVDGAVSQAGPIQGETIFQAKGRSFDLTQLLGGSEQRAAPFQDGSFTTIYLSPRDYHRIHMPVAGTLKEMVHIPGKLFSVNPATTRTIDALFARNERVAALFDTEIGPMAVIMVGAIFVGSIETVWAGEITPPYGSQVRDWQYEREQAIHLNKGEELGRFNMGSTVVLLFGAQAVEWLEEFKAEETVRMGQAIGQSQSREQA